MAVGSADADCEKLAQRMVFGGQQLGHPNPWGLWLYAGLSRRAILARSAPEHDTRRQKRLKELFTRMSLVDLVMLRVAHVNVQVFNVGGD